jgi:hypothetical protein
MMFALNRFIQAGFLRRGTVARRYLPTFLQWYLEKLRPLPI